jgi:hypothetical protein
MSLILLFRKARKNNNIVAIVNKVIEVAKHAWQVVTTENTNHQQSNLPAATLQIDKIILHVISTEKSPAFYFRVERSLWTDAEPRQFIFRSNQAVRNYDFDKVQQITSIQSSRRILEHRANRNFVIKHGNQLRRRHE